MSLVSGAAARLFRDVRHQLAAPLGVSALLMAAGALAEGVGLLTILPLLAFAAPGSRPPTWLGWLPARIDLFSFVLAVFLAIMTIRALLLMARDRAAARLEALYDLNLRLRAAATLASRGWPFAAGVGQAGMQSLLANDVPRSNQALHQGLGAATAGFMLLVQLAVAASLSWQMAAGALVLILLGIPSLVRLSRRSRLSGERMIAGFDESAQAAFTFHAGLKAAMAQEGVGDFLGGYRSILERLVHLNRSYNADLARSRTRHSIAAALAAAMVVGIGHALALDLARLVALLILFARMSAPAQQLQQSLVGIAAYASSFAAIEARLGPLVQAPPPDVLVEPLEWNTVELDGLMLSRGPESGLAPTSIFIRRGEWLAVTGPSGAGKTTLLDLVTGLLAADGGRLLVDGTPLGPSRAAGWRRSLAYVGQQELPFDDTVHGALHGASEIDCWEVLALVGLADLVRRAPEGLAMPLADRGARLSGGERQRLLIARALLRNPRLLLLDEATAAIDVAGERALIQAIRAARPALAGILVAHRAESAALCEATLIIDPPK